MGREGRGCGRVCGRSALWRDSMRPGVRAGLLAASEAGPPDDPTTYASSWKQRQAHKAHF